MTASQHGALVLPSAADVESGAKSIVAIGAILGAIWAVCRKIYRRRQEERERRELESKAIRYLLDAQRHALNVIVPHESRREIDVNELYRQKILIDQMRDRLWKADGHSQTLQDAINVLTRTQRIQAKKQGQEQDIFREGEE